ncbi:MAG: ROK family transcriptional regulator [Streptosporangiales bacterium]
MSAGAVNTTSVVRVMNERVVFDRIRDIGPVSRPQLADETGLSKPTVSLALADLERVGLVRPVGQRTGNAGRAPQLYAIRPEAGWVVAIDVGRSWLRLALANLAGEVVLRRDERNRARSAGALVTRLTETARALATDAGIEYGEVTYTVVGSPGVYDPAKATLRFAPNLLGWDRPGVVRSLHDALGPNLAIENDVDLAVLGEQEYGLGRSARDFVFLSIGTGVGMGIVVHGELYRGARGAAGEISFLPVAEDGVSESDRSTRQHGLLESAAAADAVVATARRAGMSGRLTAKKVFDAARAGDRTAQSVATHEAHQVSRALAAVVAVLDPELVVLGGGIGRNGDLLIMPAREHLRELVPLEPPPIVVSSLGSDAVVMGALATGLATARDLVFSRATESPK